MANPDTGRERRFHLGGWLLFVACSFFFIAEAVVNGGPLGLIGGVLFLAGCIVFLVPLVRPRA